MLNIIDKKIRKAFSSAAVQYDILTNLHKEIGRDLIKTVMAREQCDTILDVGMGTGWLTNKVAFYFPCSQVVGMDFAEGMIAYAKTLKEVVDMVQADANDLPFKHKSCDIVLSNLAYQWVSDLPKAFTQVHDVLKDDGVFHFTAFGHNTFQELFEAIEQTSPDKNFNFSRLPLESVYQEAMEKAGFKNIQLKTERIKVHFPEMLDLIRWIKSIGANAMQREAFVGRDMLMKAKGYYEDKYSDRFGIIATYEVVWVQGEKS